MTQRIRNLLTFLAAYGLGLFRRSAPARPPERLLLVAAGKLGDVVCTTPVMQAVRRHLPDATLIVEDTSGGNAQLLADSGLADGFVSLQGVWRAARVMRRERFDTVCLTGPSFMYLAAALLARIPRIIAPRVTGGFCPHQTLPYRHLLRFVTSYPYAFGAYAPRERLRALEPLGIEASDTTKHLGYSEQARRNADAYMREHALREGTFAVISPSAGNKIKNWPADRFARVAEHLAAKGVAVVVIGSDRDRGEVEAMMSALARRDGVSNALGAFSLDELKAFIARAGLFIAVDTGPIYIAEAFAVPTVDITGPIDEKEQPPIGPRHLVVTPPGREKPELYAMNARVYDEREARRQTEAISAEMVIRAVDTLI